jgi:hypothetical protein
MANKRSSRKKKRTGVKKDHNKPDTKELVSETTSTQPESHSRLLELPPELRNRIYHYALGLDDGVFKITEGDSIPEPALLLTSRHIRQEAIGIFYKLDAVSMEFNSFSPSVAIFVQKKMVALYRQYQFKVGTKDIVMSGSRNWRNWMLWLQHIHRDRDNDIVHVNFESALTSEPFSQDADRGAREMAVLAGMCLVASGMKGTQWSLADQALNLLRYGLVRCDREWGDESDD